MLIFIAVVSSIYNKENYRSMQTIIQSLKPIVFVLFLGVLFSCKKDDSSKPTNPVSSTVTDIDGNTYNTVTIGNQVWMKENLKVSKFRNGDLITTNLSESEWENTIISACAIYNNDGAKNFTCGKLYNWKAVVDPRGLCPAGWHVPSDAEWSTLENFLGGDSLAGGKMKEVSTLWASPNTGATNSSGFSALPGGTRWSFGRYFDLNYLGGWWSSTEVDSYSIKGRYLNFNLNKSCRIDIDKRCGYSVRCIRD